MLLVERLASHAAASSRAAVQPALGTKAAHQVPRSCHNLPTWHNATGLSETPAACMSHRTFHCGVGRQRSNVYPYSLPWQACAPSGSRSVRTIMGHVGSSHSRGAFAGTACAIMARGARESRRGFAAMGCSGAAVAMSRGHVTWASTGNAAVQAVRRWNSQTVAAYTPKLPGWVRSRLPEMPEGAHSATVPLPVITCKSSLGSYIPASKLFSD